MSLGQQRMEDEFRMAVSLRVQRLEDDLHTEDVGFCEPCAHCHSKKRTLTPHSQCGKRKKVLVMRQDIHECLETAKSTLSRTPNQFPRYDRSYSAPITTKATTLRAALFRSNSVVPLIPWPSETRSPRNAGGNWVSNAVGNPLFSAATQAAIESVRKAGIKDDGEAAGNAPSTGGGASVENEAGGNDPKEAAGEEEEPYGANKCRRNECPGSFKITCPCGRVHTCSTR